MSDEWLCDGCKKVFETEEKALEHEKTCLKAIALEKKKEIAAKADAKERERYEKRQKELSERQKVADLEKKRIAELFEKDKLENPHLALISDHLWWLALVAKISLGMMILSIIGAILLGA